MNAKKKTATKKKAASKKTAPKKTAAKRSATKKKAATKTVAKKKTATKRKTAAKKATATKTVAKKKTATKRKTAAKKKTATKTVAKKKAPAKRTTASRPAAGASTKGAGTAGSPWALKTPPGRSEFTAHRDDSLDPPSLVVQVGKTQLRYHLRCIEDLHAMLKAHGDWMLLGNADEGKPVKDGTVEAWGRDGANPVGGYYGIKKGLRGRFANYVPPVLEALGLAEVEHNPRNNRMRAK